MRTRICRTKVLAASAAGMTFKKGNAPKFLVLSAVVVGGIAIYVGSRQQCDDMAVAMRMHNQQAKVVNHYRA